MCSRSKKLVLLALAVILIGGPAQAADPDLVGWWKLDEGSGTAVVDSSGNGITGTIAGAQWASPGWHGDGWCLEFVNGAYVDLGNPDVLNLGTDDWTVTAWVKNAMTGTGDENKGTIFANGGDNSGGHRYALAISEVTEGLVTLTTDDDSAKRQATATTPVNDDEWHFVTGVRTGNTILVYIDGIEEGSNTTLPAGYDLSGTSQHNAYLGTIRANDTGNLFKTYDGLLDDVRVFKRALSQEEIDFVMQDIGIAETAYDPTPANQASDVLCDITLTWKPGEFAAKHDVYFGTSMADVNDASVAAPLGVLASEGQETTSFVPDGLLAFGTTYYWRVDEISAPPDNSVFKGTIWSFTTEPMLYPVEEVVANASMPDSPLAGSVEQIVNGSGLNADGQHSIDDSAMWQGAGTAGEPAWVQFDFDRVYKLYGVRIWNYNGAYESILGFGVKDIAIEYAAEPNTWVSGGQFQLDRATSSGTYVGQLIDLDGIAAGSVRINISSSQGGGTTYGLSEVQFLQKPVFAREPQPATGATEVGVNTVLGWRAGREAVLHDVSLGTDPNAVANGDVVVGTVTANTFDPGSLTLGTTYYWKIDEVNEAATPSVWASDVWDFATQEYISIDNFEGYTDDEGYWIFETWLDGYNADENGSTVGNTNQPFAERRIVHSGDQSMPFFYDNTVGVTYSETERVFASPQDWTAYGADTLSLWHRGDPIGLLVVSDSHIVMNGIGADIYSTADEGRFVYKQLTGNGSIVARVESIDDTDAWAKAGVMIRQGLDAGSIWTFSLWAPGNGWRFQYRAATGGAGASDSTVATDEQIAVPTPVWVKLERTGSQFNAYYATGEAPTVWIPSPVNPQTITMTDPVYIGLAVTSHDAAEVTQAEFTEIATTGNVTGQWQSASLGLDQPQGNGVDTFYIVVEDSSGVKATITNPSPAAVGGSSWRQWTIPLSDLAAAGVKLNSIKKFYLGVGDKTQPSRNTVGALYIDDLAFGHPIE